MRRRRRFHPSAHVGEIVEASRQRSLNVLAAGLGALVGLLLVSLRLARSITRPLEALVVVAKDVMRGSYDKRATASSIRELDELSEAVNHLAARVESQFAELSHQAFYDTLTGMANRSLVAERLEHAMARTRRGKHAVAVMFLDLDNFKVVNDTLGHRAGAGPQGRRHRPRGHRLRQGARRPSDCRGHRNRRAARTASRPGLRAWPGLLLRQAADGRRDQPPAD